MEKVYFDFLHFISNVSVWYLIQQGIFRAKVSDFCFREKSSEAIFKDSTWQKNNEITVDIFLWDNPWHIIQHWNLSILESESKKNIFAGIMSHIPLWVGRGSSKPHCYPLSMSVNANTNTPLYTYTPEIYYYIIIVMSLPVTISIQRFSASDTIDGGRLLPFTDDLHPSSAFNLAHVMSLSESGVSRFTE